MKVLVLLDYLDYDWAVPSEGFLVPDDFDVHAERRLWAEEAKTVPLTGTNQYGPWESKKHKYIGMSFENWLRKKYPNRVDVVGLD